MITHDQRRRADEYLALHHGPTLLILPNAWDVASAQLYELEGFKAIATASVGISSTLGSIARSTACRRPSIHSPCSRSARRSADCF